MTFHANTYRLAIFFAACLSVLTGFFATPSRAAGYEYGYVWARSATWTLNGSSPDASSKQDDQGTAVWNYTYVSGGSLINDTGTNKWWSLARTNMTAGAWFGAPVFLSGSSLSYFSQGAAQMHTNDLANAPLAVWTCPVDNAEIEVGGSVSWRGGDGTNTSSADYVLALRRAADSSWQVLDSAVFVPNGGTTPGNTRDYSGAQALAPISLSHGDQLVWGVQAAREFHQQRWLDQYERQPHVHPGIQCVHCRRRDLRLFPHPPAVVTKRTLPRNLHPIKIRFDAARIRNSR